MNTQNYPSWLVSVAQAKRLKKIRFDEPCMLYYESSISEVLLEITVATTERGLSQWFEPLSEFNFFYNEEIGECITIPTWEQVFEWFREKGYIGTINFVYIDKNNFYYKLRINGKCNFINEEKITNYEEAREKLINKLIETYETNEIL